MIAIQQYLQSDLYWCKMSVSYLQLDVFTLQFISICGIGVFAAICIPPFISGIFTVVV